MGKDRVDGAHTDICARAEKNFGKRKLRRAALFSAVFFSSAAALSACSGESYEEPGIVVESGDETASYRTVSVQRGDVELTRRISVIYRQGAEQEVSFQIAGRLVDKVYVRNGDTVEAGEILAELSADSLEEEIAALTYRITRNEILLEYLPAEEASAKAGVRLRMEGYGASEEEIAAQEARTARDYERLREDTGDQLEFDRRELAGLREELAGSRLRAEIGGTVANLKENLEWSTSRRDEVILTIYDPAGGLFEASEPELAPYLAGGEPLPMQISYGDSAGEYLLEPARMDEWGESQLLRVVSGPEAAEIAVGQIGSVTVTIERREDVLCLPSGTVHFADGAAYVYQVDEEGLRVIRWVEVGLVGNDAVEITGGLSEGDAVLR